MHLLSSLYNHASIACPVSDKVLPASLRDSMPCCVAGMDDAGLLHLATHMPQLLHLDVSRCSRITDAGLAKARQAAARCSQHGMVITLERTTLEHAALHAKQQPSDDDDDV